MNKQMIEQIKNDPDFIRLTRSRSRFAWTLSAIMLLIYFGFVLTIAFNPALLGTPLFQGTVTTVGIPIGIGVIVSAFILTGIYVRRANNEFDALNNRIKEKVQGE